MRKVSVRHFQERSGPNHADWVAAIRSRWDALSRTDAPKHARLTNVLRDVLRDTNLNLPERLPTERELARALQVSVGTVQRALLALTLEGAVSRTTGRGTFARLDWQSYAGPWHFRFVDRLGGEPEKVTCTRLRISRVSGSGPWADALGPRPDGYLRLWRHLRLGSGTEVLTRSWLPADKFEELLHIPPAEIRNENLRVMLRNRFGVALYKALQIIGADRMPDKICAALELPQDTVGLVIEVVGYDYDSAAVFYADIFCPPGPKRMEQPLAAVPWSGDMLAAAL